MINSVIVLYSTLLNCLLSQLCFLSHHFNLQAQPISSELVTRLFGNRVGISPIVTVEPRRRKFHKPISLTLPVPTAANKGMINQYNGEAPTLRLLCSITGISAIEELLLPIYHVIGTPKKPNMSR